MSPKVTPIFIISLVRSGSTLLQRVLMGDSKISSMAEPWFLLPLVYATKKGNISAPYDHSIAHTALEDVIRNLPNKLNDYQRFVREFATNIYGSLSTNESKYFLDKTPRYYMITKDLAKIFPEAKFIFLFRNPIHIYASISSTFKNERMIFGKGLYGDLRKGPKKMSKGYLALKDRSYALQYEKFIKDPEKYLKEIMRYLELEYDPDILEKFHLQDLKGRSFDPTGTVNYKSINTETLEKWKKVFNTRYRKKIITKYVNRLDKKTLAIQGYNKSEMLDDIQNIDNDGNYSYIRDVKDVNKPKIKKRLNRIKKRITSYL